MMANENETEKTEEKTLLQKAEEVAERIEKANKEAKEILERQERLRAEKLLGGTTEAGIPAKERTEEERKREQAKEFFKGSVIESALVKYG